MDRIKREKEAILAFKTNLKAGTGRRRAEPRPLYGIMPLYGVQPLYGVAVPLYSIAVRPLYGVDIE